MAADRWLSGWRTDQVLSAIDGWPADWARLDRLLRTFEPADVLTLERRYRTEERTLARLLAEPDGTEVTTPLPGEPDGVAVTAPLPGEPNSTAATAPPPGEPDGVAVTAPLPGEPNSTAATAPPPGEPDGVAVTAPLPGEPNSTALLASGRYCAGERTLVPLLHGPHVAAVAALVTLDRSGRLREAGVRWLAGTGDPFGLPFLLLRAADPVDQVRTVAIAALERWLVADRAPLLTAMLPIVERLRQRRRGQAVAERLAEIIANVP
jgi:hypothetical protein